MPTGTGSLQLKYYYPSNAGHILLVYTTKDRGPFFGHTYLLRTCRADFDHFWLERTPLII
jgi:hypothetical protein